MPEMPHPAEEPLDEAIAEEIAHLIHPPKVKNKRPDDIDLEAKLRERIAQLDPDSSVIYQSTGHTLPEAELHRISTLTAKHIRNAINSRIEKLAAEITFDKQLIEEGVYTPDTDKRLKELLAKEYKVRKMLIDAIKLAGRKRKITDTLILEIEEWIHYYRTVQEERREVEEQIKQEGPRD